MTENTSHWFNNNLPQGMGDNYNDQIIPGASAGMTRYKALYVEAVENMSDPNIYYDINSAGYRCPPFEDIDYDKVQIIIAGCSFTFGIGVSEDHCWPAVLTKKFPDKFQVWNLGIPGASNDTIVRTISAYLNYIKPAFIFLQWANPNRREYVTSDNYLKKILSNHPRYQKDNSVPAKSFFNMQNKYFDQYCFEKNLMFMLYMTKAYKINFIWQELSMFPELDTTRDEHHPGPKSHEEFANTMYKHYEKILGDHNK